MRYLYNASRMPHFDSQDDFDKANDATNAFKRSIGDDVNRYSVRLRFHPTDQAGHVAFDYQAHYKDGTKSTWYSLSENESAFSLFSLHNWPYLEIPYDDITSLDDISRVKEILRNRSLKRGTHFRYDLMSANCVDQARYVMRQILPDTEISQSSIPRKFMLESLEKRFVELERLSTSIEEKSAEEQQNFNFKILQHLKTVIDFLQTGYDKMSGGKYAYDGNITGEHFVVFQPPPADDPDCTVDISKLSEEERAYLAKCPELPVELYHLHRDLIKTYMPACKKQPIDIEASKQALEAVVSSLIQFLPKKNQERLQKEMAEQKAKAFFSVGKKKFGRTAKTWFLSFCFTILRFFKSHFIPGSKFKRAFQKGHDWVGKRVKENKKRDKKVATQDKERKTQDEQRVSQADKSEKQQDDKSEKLGEQATKPVDSVEEKDKQSDIKVSSPGLSLRG